MQYSNPNPHTRYEINLQRVPGWVTLLFAFATIALILCAVCLIAQYDEELYRVPKVTVPNVSAEIQNKVDDVVKKVVKQ